MKSRFTDWAYWTTPQNSIKYPVVRSAVHHHTVHRYREFSTEDFQAGSVWTRFTLPPAHLQWLWVAVTVFPGAEALCLNDVVPGSINEGWYDLQIRFGEELLVSLENQSATVLLRTQGEAALYPTPLEEFVGGSFEAAASRISVRTRQTRPSKQIEVRFRQSLIYDNAPLNLPISLRVFGQVADVKIPPRRTLR